MADTSERTGQGLGGLVDRHTAAERLAARGRPLIPLGEPVDFTAVDRVRDDLGRNPFVARAAIDTFHQLHPGRVDLHVDGETITAADDHRLRSLAALIGDPTTITLTGSGATVALTIGPGRVATDDPAFLERVRRIIEDRDWTCEL